MSSLARTRRRRALREAARCPDCRSDVRSAGDGAGGIEWFKVLHDETCPWYRARGAQPFRQLRVVEP